MLFSPNGLQVSCPGAPGIRRHPAALLGSLLALIAAGLAWAGADAARRNDDGFEPNWNPTLAATPARGPIDIDGRLGDPGWAQAARVGNFSEHEPGDQVKPPVDTEAWITYDRDRLYVAFLCHDDPRSIRATRCERDNIWQDDVVVFCLDTYGTGAWAYEIACNPFGVQGDILFTAGHGEDTTYDLVYESAGSITEQGYVVEMAIPFTSLRFPDNPEQTWRMDFWRNHPRAVRGQYSWVAYSRDLPCWACQWGTVTGVTGVRPGQGIELLPAFVSSQTGRRDLSGRFENGDILGEPSLGAKFSPSSSVAAEATVNPDFSQVESDAAQIDVNTTFALSYPEKRPFFLEGSDLFSSYFRVVYTRAINDPLFAAKLVGRPGRTQFGILTARDERTPIIMPFSERSGFVDAGPSVSTLARARRELGTRSHLGVIATDRRYDGGGSGTLAGIDGRVGFAGPYEAFAQALVTRTIEPDDTSLTQRLDGVTFSDGRHTAAFDGESYWGDGLLVGLSRDGRSLDWSLLLVQRSPTYRADCGFQERNDQRYGNLQAGWQFYEPGPFVSLRPMVEAQRMWDYAGTRKDEYMSLNLEGSLPRGQTHFHANYLRSSELFGGKEFRNIWGWHLCGSSVPFSWLEAGGNINYGHRIARGDMAMGRQWSGGVSLDLKPLDRLWLAGSLDWIRSRSLDSGDLLFDGYVARSRVSLQLSHALSTRLVIQYDDFARLWEVDPLVTLRLNPFSIFYAGSTRHYQEVALEEGSPSEWRLADRQYFLKLQYLFQM